MKQIEVLYVPGCPNLERAEARSREAAARAGGAEIRLVPVDSDEAAQRLAFLGSPTVRVDGRDVEGASAGRTEFGVQCRVYANAGRLEGAPPLEWIVAALGTTPA
jgi:hypothetical protein